MSAAGDQSEPEVIVKKNLEPEVHDERTEVVKRETEADGNVQIKGQYTLIDAYGNVRTVEYTADNENGLNAIAHREPAKNGGLSN